MSDITWTNCKVRLGDLRKWEGNPAEISKAAAGRLVESFNEFGQAHVILIEPDYQILDGHQRDDVWGAKFGDDFMVDCRMSSRKFTDEERRKFVIYLRSGTTGNYSWDTLSGWDAKELIEWGLDDITLRDWKRDVTALDNLLESEKPEPVDAEPQVDRAAELNEKWQVKTGDLWQIGNHRLLCGDSTVREDVDRVMGVEKADMVFTDPPYGMRLDADFSSMEGMAKGNKYEDVIGDDTDYNPSHIFDLFGYCNEIFLWGADYYSELIPNRNDGSWFVWDKTEGGVRTNTAYDKMFGSNFELCWSKQRHKRALVRVLWKGIFGLSKEPEHKRMHPTQKPTELAVWFIEKFSKIDQIIVDLFCGSGFVLLACENLHRKCRAIEISPNYCAVILERMQTAFPELEIRKVTEG